MSTNSMSTSSCPLPGPSRLARAWPALVLLPAIATLLSAVITWINVGWSDNFGSLWLRGLASALPAIVVALAFMAAVEGPVHRAFASQPLVLRKVILALLTACVIELMVASAVTLANVGFSAAFWAAGVGAFLKSLPLGVCISLLMAFVVKPRLDRLAG